MECGGPLTKAVRSPPQAVSITTDHVRAENPSNAPWVVILSLWRGEWGEKRFHVCQPEHDQECTPYIETPNRSHKATILKVTAQERTVKVE